MCSEEEEEIYWQRYEDGPDLSSDPKFLSWLQVNGCIHSLDWTTGLEYWTGLLEQLAHAQFIQCHMIQQSAKRFKHAN